MREMGNLMYMSKTPESRWDPRIDNSIDDHEEDFIQPRWTILSWARQCYYAIRSSIPGAKDFSHYIATTDWLREMDM